MSRPFEKMFSKKFTITNNINSISKQMDYSYEEAIKPREISLIDEISDFNEKQNTAQEELHALQNAQYVPADLDQHPTDEEITIYNKQSDLYYMQDLLEQQLHSLKEMQIIHLYKNFEILLKEMIVCAFPNTNKRDLFKWENVKDTFKTSSIEFSSLESYQYVNQLRITNNNIKHSPVITEEVKSSINEFKRCEEFDYIQLDAFHTRIKPKVNLFLREISNALLSHLYTFSEDRINIMANEYAERMDSETLKKFANAIDKKSHNKSFKF